MILILHDSTAIPSSIILITMDEYLKSSLDVTAHLLHAKTTVPEICYSDLSVLKNYGLGSEIGD